MKFQKTMKTWEINAGALVKADDGRYDMQSIGTALYTDTCITDTKARKALKDAGVEVRKGMNVTYVEVASETVAWDIPIDVLNQYKVLSSSLSPKVGVVSIGGTHPLS